MLPECRKKETDMIDMMKNHDAWQKLFDDLGKDRPSVGKKVLVTSGKHKGKVGRVFWHGRNPHSDAWRYGGEAEHHFRDAAGKYGFRVGIRIFIDDEEIDKFFVDANKVDVIEE